MQLSILTINYNNAIGLQKTVESVVKQTFTDFEYIIIDGGSTDNSLEIVKQHEDRITSWVSEPDKGIYHAMNKGIERCTSEYIMFLNSGDYLANNEIISEVIPLLGKEAIIYGNLLIQEKKTNWIKVYPDNLQFSYFIYDSLPHSGGIFIRRSAFKGELEFYDETLKIVSDWKWFIIGLFKYLYSYKHINQVIGVFDYSGVSAKPENSKLLNDEKRMIMQKHFPSFYEEISELLKYKIGYNTLMSSRYLKICLGLKQLIKFK